MKQFRQLKFENDFWILQYYNEDEELVQEQFVDLQSAREYIDSLGFHLNFDPN
jgi:hypothetical protein